MDKNMGLSETGIVQVVTRWMASKLQHGLQWIMRV